MVPKLISKTIVGILILLVLGAMVWQVAPVSAGFTPTPTSTIMPTVPPTATPSVMPTARPSRPTAVPPTTTPISSTVTPTATLPVLLPITGGLASDPNSIDINAISIAGVLSVLLAVISLVIRKSARTRTDN